MLLALILICAYPDRWPTQDDALRLILDLGLDSSFVLTGVGSLGGVLLLVAAARLRLGRSIRSRLHVRPPRLRDVVLVIGCVAPMAVLSNMLFDIAEIGWIRVVPEFAEAPSTLKLLDAQIGSAPFLILVAALAVGPAVGEELVFRGVIGQGLVGRLGVGRGVLITSLLFAGAHLYPPHIIATIPLAVFLHYVYLVTRSLWAPILLHGLNNALSVAMAKFPIADSLPSTPTVMVCSGLYVLVVAMLLSRDRQHIPHGGLMPNRFSTAAAGGCIVAFTLTFFWTAMNPAAL